MQKLTPKQEKFCLEYVKTGFTGQAYINAGYKAKTKVVAEANGRRLLEKEYIQKRIEKIMNKIQNEDIADAKEVLRYLTKGIRMELEEEVIVIENIGSGLSKARVTKKQIALKESIRCAELLGKRYSLFTDKVDVSGSLETEKSKLDDLVKQLMDPDG
ncbi:MAG: terminase small subunit [Eubacterium sp.]